MFKNEYFFSIFSKITIMIVGLFTTMAMSRYLGPSLKGELAYITNIVSILSIILGLGIEQSYGYFYKRNHINFMSKYVKVIKILNLFYLIIFIVLNVLIRNNIFLYISILSLLYIVCSQLSYILIIESINKRNKIILFTNSIYCLLIILLYLINKRSIVYPILALIIKVGIEIFLYINFIKNNNVNKKIYIERSIYKKIFKLGIPAMLMGLMITFNYNIDVIILKNYVDFRQIGLYTTGVSLANLAWLFSDAFKDVLFSKTAKSNGINHVVLAIKINIILSLIMIIIFGFIGKFVILIINGPQFLDSFGVTLIILIGTIPMIFFKLINTIYINEGKQLKSLIILSISVLTNIIMNIIVIPYYGIIGAAISSVISYLICGLIFLISFSKEFNVKYREFFIFRKKELKNIFKN